MQNNCEFMPSLHTFTVHSLYVFVVFGSFMFMFRIHSSALQEIDGDIGVIHCIRWFRPHRPKVYTQHGPGDSRRRPWHAPNLIVR